MAVKLYFVNDNPEGTVLEIFRDTAEIDRENLPDPIHTTTEVIQDWIDETAIKGLEYYYIFKTNGEIDYKITRNIKILALDDKGVGPDKLHVGNLNYGYYGELSANLFLSGQQLCEAIGVTFPVYGSPTSYHKYALDGKTVFVPNTFVGKGLSYDELIAAGLLDGVTFQHGQFTYKVRLMKGWDDYYGAWNDFIVNVGDEVNVETVEGFVSSEYNKLVYPMVRYVPAKSEMQNVDSRSMAELGHATNVYMLMAEGEGDPVNVCLARGGKGVLTENRSALTSTSGCSTTLKNNYIGFFPVIELVEEVGV